MARDHLERLSHILAELRQAAATAGWVRTRHGKPRTAFLFRALSMGRKDSAKGRLKFPSLAARVYR
jgi:hypothetical protein